MKGYVVTLFNLSQSVEMASRCVDSAKPFGIDVYMSPAVDKTIAQSMVKQEGLQIGDLDEKYANPNAVAGNFVAQYRIWKKIVEDNEPSVVLEHDAVFTNAIPGYATDGDIVNWGKPSFGTFREQKKPGIYPQFAKPGGYLAGAHGYYVTPTGAQLLIDKAREIGVFPCDLYLNKKNFPMLKEIWPWIIEARDEFTTIQKVEGCTAKHNYDDDYKIL